MKKHLRGKIYWVRYLDDFVVCCQFKDDAQRIFETLSRRLNKFNLELEPKKTAMVEFGSQARGSAKKEGLKPATIYFLGFTLYCGLTNRGKFIVCLKTEKTRLNRAYANLKVWILKARHLSLRQQQKLINMFLQGHYRYYGLSTNATSLVKIYSFAYKFWKKSLSRRSQRGLMSWSAYSKIFQYHPLAKPKVYISFVQMKTLAGL